MLVSFCARGLCWVLATTGSQSYKPYHATFMSEYDSFAVIPASTMLRRCNVLGFLSLFMLAGR